jgi:hypothetical protein
VVRKGAIALSAVAVLGALLLAVYTARSRTSEPSGGAWQPATPAGDAAASANTDAAAPSRPHWDTEEDPHWTAGVPLRPMDRDIIAALQSGTVERTSMTDVFPDRPYKVRFAGSPASQTFAYVLVDLDRDDKWDERWDLSEPGTIKRTVEHDPLGEGQKVMYTLVKGRWQPH